MAALGQGGVALLVGTSHGQLSPVSLLAGQTLVFTHGLNRRAFQVLVSSGSAADFGQILNLPVTQPFDGGRYDSVTVENDTLATVQVFVACRWEEISAETTYITSGDSRLSLILEDNPSPTITSSAVATSLVENSGANQVVYSATADEAVTWRLKEENDHAAFSISGANVSLIANPDYETQASYSFTVVATDTAGNTSEQAVSLSIIDVDEVAPIILSGDTATSLVENSGANQAVYSATANEPVTWSLKEVDDHAAFGIDASTGMVTLLGDPDYEAQASYSFTVVATDAAGNTSEQVVSLNIIDAVVIYTDSFEAAEGWPGTFLNFDYSPSFISVFSDGFEAAESWPGT